MKNNEGWVGEGRVKHQKKQSSIKSACMPLMYVSPSESKQMRKYQGGIKAGVSSEESTLCMDGDLF